MNHPPKVSNTPPPVTEEMIAKARRACTERNIWVHDDHLAEIITAALAARSNQEATPDETGWLIEEDAGGVIHWIALAENIWQRGWYASEGKSPMPVERVKDANDALRFARKQDAEAFADLFQRYLLCPKVTEHCWPVGDAEVERVARALAEADGYVFADLAHPSCITSPRMNGKGHWLNLARVALGTSSPDTNDCEPGTK
jgi:hypothetical protein